MPPIQRNRQWHRPQQGQQTPDSDPRRQQQPQSTGLLDQIGQTANTPLDFSGAPPIRDQNIIQPSTSPVNVPGAREATGPLQATGPVGFSGPNQLGYGGQRIGTGQTFSAPGDVRGVGAGQQGQYGMGAGPGVGPSRMIGGPGQSQRFGMQSGPGVGPSRTMGFDPNSGAYFQAPNRDFAGQGDSLEQATFQRGLNRIDPYLQEQRSAMAQRLQNQGLPVGSEAYNQELNRFDRSRGDQLENLALSSVGAGRQEQGRLFGQDFASGQFNASEAQRQFGERLGATSFNAGEQGRGFREALAANQNQFGQGLASQQFNAGESARQFGEGLARSQFSAGEEGRGFREALAANQNIFGQGLASNQFNAAESSRRYGELSQSQSQQNRINLDNRRFDSGEAQRDFANRMASESQFFGQQQVGDQFRANQANTADQQAIQQNQFGDQFGAGQSRFADQFGAQQQQQGFANRMQNQNLLGQNDRFLAQQQANQFQQDTQRRGISNQEMMQQRQDPYNQLNQLLGFAGQVGNPSFQQTQQFGPMAPNYMNQANQHFQQQQQNRFDWGGLISGGAQAAIAASDRKVKRDIKKLGEFVKGISWYTFRYIGGAKKRIGFMADEVQKVLPQAVHDVNGVLAVDYGMVFDAAR